VYDTGELVAVTTAEFRRGLEGLTGEEALIRHPKADDSRTNAASWIVAHVAAHWANAQAYATGRESRAVEAPADGTPPAWADALAHFDTAIADLSWVSIAGDDRMAQRDEGRAYSPGTFLMRAVMHTWFHCGELNAIRQLLGHPEISFVGPFNGALEWVPEGRRS
jgi:hypothetical protein